MDNIKNDNYYTAKVMKDVQYLMGLTEKYSYEEIEKNELFLDSVFFRFIQIAENASKLSNVLKMKHRNIDWGSISGLRNRIVHDYGRTDLRIIIETLKFDIPELKKVLEQYIK